MAGHYPQPHLPAEDIFWKKCHHRESLLWGFLPWVLEGFVVAVITSADVCGFHMETHPPDSKTPLQFSGTH